ncbi:hypothetical protein BKA58DRAFT_403038 [Alternaria rosae]|uniref:uncharacterized protein n=1 Tax=Alternaria rosae TaxID=1187941 RepID=UPI001E8D55AF|nr:uncharacterized protein BKA58DRAFT_403038 [Alternaria rosae]KAH6868694.1 hypothetical protein BKA58DRAFT_403038 [Alternaria rosae]
MADNPSDTPTTIARPTTTQPYGFIVTPFTPPDYCSTPIRDCPGRSGFCRWFERDRTCGSDGRATIASECFPPGTGSLDSYLSTYSEILYASASNCPEGWHNVGTISTRSTHTVVACCPSSYRGVTGDDDGNIGPTCVSNVDPASSTVVQIICIGDASPITTTSTRPSADGINDVWADQIHLILPQSESASTTDDPSSTSASTAFALPTSETTPPATDSSSKSPLPKGAIAGIAVGFAILLLIALCTPVWVLHRRKQRQHTDIGTKKRIPFDFSSLPELVGIKGNGGSSTEMSLGHPNDVVPRDGEMGASSTPITR